MIFMATGEGKPDNKIDSGIFSGNSCMYVWADMASRAILGRYLRILIS